jgi:Leucine-rich repeat (LRR) protein/predicted GH43/DUF377 family glycosyl hydrolase
MKRIYAVMIMSIVTMNLCCQIHWTKHPDNPVMVPGSAGEWDEGIIAPGSVLYHNGSYNMWYWGGDIGNVNLRIGHATSLDGITWTKDINNPILSPGPQGAWDGVAVGDPTVIFNDSIFHMWYEGTPTKSLSEGMQIGHATSPDGIHWTKDTNNPVLEIGTSGKWDDQWVSQPEVIYNGSEYHMWYGGDNNTIEKMSIGHATSVDGTTWTKDAENPVLISEASGDWDYPRVNFPKVIFDGTSFKMFYSGGDFAKWQIGCATSVDGINWKKYVNNPVLSNGTSGTWDASFAAFTPVIDSAGVKFKMWYLGGSSLNSSGIGYAESSPCVDIPDTFFLFALIDKGVDTNGDSLISYAEAEAVHSLNVNGGLILDNWAQRIAGSTGQILSLEGIESFKNLEALYCQGNQITDLDLTENLSLKVLDCSVNELTSLGFPEGSIMDSLACGMNPLVDLDVSQCSLLKHLDLRPTVFVWEDPYNLPFWGEGTQLTALDITKNVALETLMLIDSRIIDLDLSNNTVLREFRCSGNQLTSLDISRNTDLQALVCARNQLTGLDVSKNTALERFDCSDNQLDILDVSHNTELELFWCWNNRLTSLAVSNLTMLKDFICHSNLLTELDLSQNTALTWINISDMPTLKQVCVWVTPFPPNGVGIDKTGSPNVYFTTECTIGIKETNPSEQTIYPNPANNLLTIESEYPDHYSIEVSSLNGQQILIGEMEGTIHKIDLSSFQKGVYFITIRSKDFVTTRKIIKL